MDREALRKRIREDAKKAGVSAQNNRESLRARIRSDAAKMAGGSASQPSTLEDRLRALIEDEPAATTPQVSTLPMFSAEEARNRARAMLEPSNEAKAGMEFAAKEEKETQYAPSLIMPQSREDQLWLANHETPLSPDYDPTETKSSMIKIAQQYARGGYSSPAVDTYEKIAENALGDISEKVKHPEIAAYEQEHKTQSTADALAQGQYTRDILAGDAQSDDTYTSQTTADVLVDTEAEAKSAARPKEQTKAQSDREAYYTAGMKTFESIPLEKRDILYDYFWIRQVADSVPDTKSEIRYKRPDGQTVVISREKYNSLKSEYESLIAELGKTHSADDLERMQNTLAAYANELNRAQSDVLTAKFATMQPVAASLGSIGGRMVGGITATADLIGQNLAKIGKEDGYKKPVDYNTLASATLNAANVGRGTVSENISYTAGDFASFIYDATMSIADTTVTGALPGGKVLSSVSLVASTAFDSAKAAADRGAEDWQALGVGLVSGALELAVEKIPKFGTLSRLEDLKDIPIASLGDLVRSTFASAHLEGCEEALTEILNRINECIWSPSTSSLAVAIAEYEAQNNSFTDAFMLAVRDMSLDVLKAYGGGFIGGAEMQGSLGTMNYALNNGVAKEYRDLFVGSDGKLNETTYNALMTKAFSSKDEAVQKYAAVLADRGNSVTANDAGMLYAMLEASEEQVDFAAEIDSPARTVEEMRDTFSKNGQADIATELTVSGVAETQARSLAALVVAVLNGEEISGNKALAVAQNPAARAILERATGTTINADAPLSEVKAAIRDLASSRTAAQTQAATVSTAAKQNGAQGEKSGTVAHDAIERMASFMGKIGQNTLRQFYLGDVPALDYAEAMTRWYNAGREGKAADFRSQNDVLNEKQREAAYKAGQFDAENALAKSRKKEYTESDNSFEEGEEHDRETNYDKRRNGVGGHDSDKQISAGKEKKRGASGVGKKGGKIAGRDQYVQNRDSEGNRISESLLNRLEETAIIDQEGRPIAVYHSTTDMHFDTFAKGDIGFHFGTKKQAANRAKGKMREQGVSHGRLFRSYLNINSPLFFEKDIMNWHAAAVAFHFWNEGIFSESERDSVLSLITGKTFEERKKQQDYDQPASARVRELLAEKGYDGIAYKNDWEGEGYSYIALYPEQVVTESISVTDFAEDAEPDSIGEEVNREIRADDSTEIMSDRWSADRVGDKPKKIKSLSEIIAGIQHDFGINITTGHIRSKDARGQYNTKNDGVRTKIANNLPTISHELGHHFDTVYGIRKNLPKDIVKELQDNFDNKAAYAQRLWTTEGIAEFMRKFLQNREVAAIDYPLFTEHFLSALSGKDRALIEQLADEINAYYSLDADTATSAIRLREDGAADASTFGDKIKDGADALYQAFTDSNHGIKLFDEATGANTYKLATNAAYSDAIAGQIISDGDLTDADGRYVAPGLKAALHGVNLRNKTEYMHFGEYLTVKHGPERLREGQRIFADDRKNSTVFMQRRQAELERQYPEFKEASERLYKFQRDFLETWGVKTGLVSREKAAEWAERWNFYVPLNRAVPKKRSSNAARRGFANQNSTIHKAMGSGLDIVHPVDNIVYNITAMVNAGVRNNVMRKITDAAVSVDANAMFLEKVPTPMIGFSVDATSEKAKLRAGVKNSFLADVDKAAVFEIIDGMEDILKQYGRGKAYGDVITVMKGGKPEFWKINDPLLLSSITNLSPGKMEGILDVYAQVSRFMTSNITGNNVIWGIFSNMPRDLQTMWTYSKVKNPFKLFGALGSSYVNRVKNAFDTSDPLYKEYLALGGGNVSAYSADRDLAKRARKKLGGSKIRDYVNPIDWIGAISDAIEAGPRFATYKLMRQNGMEPQDAFYEAMDITVNFRRGGAVSRDLNKVLPFFNAGVQGLDKFQRWVTAEDAPKDVRKKSVCGRTISYVTASLVLAVLFYGINNWDDDDEKNYEQLSNHTKNSYWCIPLGDGRYFAIPKPRELAVLSSLFETCMEYGIGKNDHAFDGFYNYFADSCLPGLVSEVAQGDWQGAIGSLGIVGVGAYMMANRDFLGRPIVSAGLQNLEPKKQYTSRTSKIAYWLGQAFNASPQMIDFFFGQTLGGWWKYQKALFPVGEENIDPTLGIYNSYIKDNQYSTDLVNWMYDKSDASEKARNSDPSNMDKQITYKMDKNMTDFYSMYYAIAKNSSDEATRGTRQLVLDMLLEYQKASDSGALTKAQEAAYAVCKKQGSAEFLPTVMQSTIKDGEGKDRSLSDVQYVEYQTDYLRLYWEMVEDTLPDANTDAEKCAVLESAKKIAKEKATDRTLARICAPRGDYSQKYSGVPDSDVVLFKAYTAMEHDRDGGVTQADAEEILDGMDLTNELRKVLWQSANKAWSAKNNPYK